MLWQVRELTGCAIGATDGELGRLQDVYFDDQRWIVSYLVADTGHWPAGRRVLLAPISVRRITWTHRRVEVALTRAQVRSSPDFDTHKPVERQHEIALHEYYGFPYAWTDEPHRGVAASPVGDASDPHLRSARAVIGYTVHAVDGEVGHVEDFVVDDRPWWAIPYMVVDTQHRWPGKRVLVSSEWIGWVSWMELGVHVGLPRDTIREAPAYDPGRPVDGAYEARLRGYFGRPPYWSPADRAA